MSSNSPCACDRLALSDAARQRHFELLTPALRESVLGAKELPNGFAFQLPVAAEAIQTAAQWAAHERLCCPFLEIALRFERERGGFWLELTGRDGVAKQSIQSIFAEWFPAPQ